jgi:hypothetical protein
VAEVTARCPRCKLVIAASPDKKRFLICPQCGARLRAAAAPSVAVPTPSAASPEAPASPPPPSPVPAGEPAAPPSDGLQAGIRALLRGQEEGLHILREILAIVRSRPAPVDAEGWASSSDPFSGVFGEPVADDAARPTRRRYGSGAAGRASSSSTTTMRHGEPRKPLSWPPRCRCGPSQTAARP